MNKSYRTTWSESRQAYVVTHEKAATHGKPSSTRKVVTQAVTAALMALGAGQAMAVSDCNTPGVIVLDGAATATCDLASGDSLTVTGSIDVANQSGARVIGGASVSGITIGSTGTVAGGDPGGFSFSQAIMIGWPGSHGTVGGNIDNQGLVEGRYPNGGGVFLYKGTVGGNILNTGNQATITGAFAGVMADGTSNQISGGITNSGRIQGATYGMYLNRLTMANNGISNSAVIRNTGTAAGAGIYMLGSSTIHSIDNTNLISGSGTGIIVKSTVITNGLTNTGSIVGTGAVAGGHGISLSSGSTISGGISNSGLIAGQGNTGNGIYVYNGRVNGGILNSGTISGNGFYGVFVGAGKTVSGGITNSGLISGNQTGLWNAGVISGGIHVTGNDTARFAGTNYAVYSPGTTMSVESGATYTINDGDKFVLSTFTNDGTLKLDAASTGTINGNFVNNGTFRVGVADMSTYSRLQVADWYNVTLAGGLYVDAAAATGLSAGTLTGVVASGANSTLSGTFATVEDNSSLFNFEPIYGANSFDLQLVSAGPAGGLAGVVGRVGSPAALGAAGALDQIFLDTSNPITQLFLPVSTGTDQEIADAIMQLLPVLIGAVPQSGVNALHSMNKIIQSRVESVQGLNSGDETADQYGWVRAFGNWGDQDDHKGVPGFESRTQGLALGIDKPVTDRIRAGGLFTYARSDVNSNIGNSNVDVDTYEIAGYGSYNIDPQTDINVQLDVGINKAESTRRIAFTGTTASVDFDSFNWHVSGGIGHLFHVTDKTSLTPAVRVDYTHVRTEGYTENGAGPLNLSVKGSIFEELLLTADAKLSHKLTDDGLKFVANGSVGYDFINEQAQSSSTFTGGGPSFVSKGLEVSPWVYRGGFGLVKETGNGLELSARYDTEGRTSGYLNQTASVKFRWAF